MRSASFSEKRTVRSTDRRWRIGLLNGPNMPNLGHRDKAVYGTISSMDALVKYFGDACDALGVDLAPRAHGPGGLAPPVERRCPDMRRALSPGPFSIAGAGFEPATFGL